jgi:hypothetical protein
MNIQDVIDTAIDRGSIDIVLTRKLYLTFCRLINCNSPTLKYRDCTVRAIIPITEVDIDEDFTADPFN